MRLHSADRFPRRDRSGALLSITLHVLGALAAFGAADGASYLPEPPHVQETHFVLQKRDVAPAPSSATDQRGTTTLTSAPPLVLAPPIDVPVGAPEVTLNAPPIGEADWSRAAGSGTSSDSATGGTSTPLPAAAVDRPVIAVPGSPSPRYPATLRAAGIEGMALVQFIVDTTGRVELPSFVVLQSSHDLFAAAVRATLAELRFLPAEANGRRVRQLVQQPFVFAIAPR
jgi:protein TonB